MTTKRLTDFAQVEMLYNTRLIHDFASDELRPLASLRSSWQKNEYECYGFFDEDRIAGYAFFVHREGNYLLDYFAIARERRDQGLGSAFLGQLAECLKGADCVICEVENPDAAETEKARRQRERRLQFYLGNGFLRTEVTIVLFGVNYRVLELFLGREHTAEEVRQVYADVYHSILSDALFCMYVRIR